MRSVIAPATTVIVPVPDGTTAALAVRPPALEFNVETLGYGCPAGHADKNGTGPGDDAVMFSEYAAAGPGMGQLLDEIGKSRLVYADRLGGPNGLVFP